MQWLVGCGAMVILPYGLWTAGFVRRGAFFVRTAILILAWIASG